MRSKKRTMRIKIGQQLLKVKFGTNGDFLEFIIEFIIKFYI